MNQDTLALAAVLELMAELKAAKIRIAELETLPRPAEANPNIVVLDKS